MDGEGYCGYTNSGSITTAYARSYFIKPGVLYNFSVVDLQSCKKPWTLTNGIQSAKNCWFFIILL